jgi:riboflavin synthase alpha subunit
MATVSHLDLKPGQRVKITQTVKVGSKVWPHAVEGVVRDVKTLVTGLATQRNPDDIITVATVHFMKDNKELSSIAVDEKTQIELI